MELAAAALLYIYCTCSDWTSLLDANPIEIGQSSIDDDRRYDEVCTFHCRDISGMQARPRCYFERISLVQMDSNPDLRDWSGKVRDWVTTILPGWSETGLTDLLNRSRPGGWQLAIIQEMPSFFYTRWHCIKGSFQLESSSQFSRRV